MLFAEKLRSRVTIQRIIIWSALTGRTNGRRAKRKSNGKKMNKKMVIKILSYTFLKFLAVGDYLCYSLKSCEVECQN